MKKFGIVLVVLILAVLLSLPFINGIILEQTVHRALDNINQTYADTGSDMRIEVQAYNRGLFDTEAEFRVDFGHLAGVYGAEEMVLVEKADHGFWGINSQTSLEKNPWYLDWVRTRLNGKDPLKIQTRYSVTGPIISTITLDGFVMETEKAPVNIGALELKVSADKTFTAFNTTGRWEGLSENASNKMGPITFELDHTKITNLVWQGKGTIVVDKFISDEEGAPLSLSDLSCTYEITADPDVKKMNMGMDLNAGEVEFNGQTLSQWGLDWGVDNVDIQAYEALAKIYSTAMNAHLAQLAQPGLSPDTTAAVVNKAMAQNAPQFIAGLEKLLKKDLEIKISRLDFELPQGKINGSLSLGLNQDVSMAQFIMLATQPSQGLDIFSLESDLSLPRGLMGNRQDLIVPAFPGMKTGFFIQEGDRLIHRARIRENKLYINGQEVKLDF